MRVRAKMTVTSIEETWGGQKNIKLTCVHSTTGENKDFAAATPSGGSQLSISPGFPAQEAFKVGQEFYADFTPVEESVAS